ncbi:MAG: hypothetical protein HC821_04150 [Lewinella sp.]|nr:hypothetical protein [Lewinella sp.]
MRNRIVVWGRNAQEERVLITLELLAEQNIVKLQTFQEKTVTDEVYQAFMDHWRKGEEANAIPEPHKVWARELSVSDSLLPEELRVEQGEMVNRAQTEWHYLVLSEKLKMSYQAELAEMTDRVERSGKYEPSIWDQLKAFWEKVQTQLRDKTLLREHSNELRQGVDTLFNQLKELREKVTDELREKSAATVSEFAQKLEEIEKRISEGSHLRQAFDQLRQLQSKFHNAVFSKDDRKLIYDRIDGAFKAVKEKRSGGGSDSGSRSDGNSATNRLQARLSGLLQAIEKMERSVNGDKKDLEFENRRIANSYGQLEAQIRQAKIKMIESRIESKQVKLDDMLKTKAMLENNIAAQVKRDEKNAQRQAERDAARAVKEKIAAEIKAEQADLSPEEAHKLQAAAAAIQAAKTERKGNKKKDEPSADPSKEKDSPNTQAVAAAVAVAELLTPTPSVEPASAATASVVSPQLDSSAGVEQENASTEGHEQAFTAIESGKELLAQAMDFLEVAGEKLEDFAEDALDTARAVAEVAGQKIEAAVDHFKAQQAARIESQSEEE